MMVRSHVDSSNDSWGSTARIQVRKSTTITFRYFMSSSWSFLLSKRDWREHTQAERSA